MIASDGAPTLAGSMTWNPCPDAGAPSAWMEIATAAWASLPIAARLSTHGPTLVLSVRVMTTFAPAALSRATSRVATSNVNAASWYPLFVWVPVVAQALVPVPMGTGLLMSSGGAPLPPLWPGSTRIGLPDTACRSSGPAAGTDAFADGEPDADGDAEPGAEVAGSAAADDAPGWDQCAAAGEPGPPPAHSIHPAGPGTRTADTPQS